MKVMMIPVIVGTLGIVPKKLKKTLGEQDIRGRIETIQTMARLQSTLVLGSIPRDLWRLAAFRLQ